MEAAIVSTPTPPDPVATANAQAADNQQTAETQQALNLTNQVTPYGSVNYAQTGNTSYVDSNGKTISVPQYTQTTTYNPQEQGIFNASSDAQSNIANIAKDQSASLENYLNTKFTPTNLPDVNSIASKATAFAPNASDQTLQQLGTTPFSFNNQDATNFTYDLEQSRVAPQQQLAQQQLETQLTNRGLQPGSAGWNATIESLGRTQNDQNNQLLLGAQQQAYTQALGTQQQNVSQASTAAQQADAQQLAQQQAAYSEAIGANQNDFSQQVAERNQPINEITALLGGSQLQAPNAGASATPQTSVGGVDYTGLVENNYNQQVAASNAALGGMFGLAGTAVGGATKAAGNIWSDRRLKTDIEKVGELDNGLPVHSFRFKAGGPPVIGLIAQDVAKVKPEAVATMPGGWLGVDYAKAVQ
jgi:hypothetical protein